LFKICSWHIDEQNEFISYAELYHYLWNISSTKGLNPHPDKTPQAMQAIIRQLNHQWKCRPRPSRHDD
jgi:hypothetical protein